MLRFEKEGYIQKGGLRNTPHTVGQSTTSRSSLAGPRKSRTPWGRGGALFCPVANEQPPTHAPQDWGAAGALARDASGVKARRGGRAGVWGARTVRRWGWSQWPSCPPSQPPAAITPPQRSKRGAPRPGWGVVVVSGGAQSGPLTAPRQPRAVRRVPSAQRRRRHSPLTLHAPPPAALHAGVLAPRLIPHSWRGVGGALRGRSSPHTRVGVGGPLASGNDCRPQPPPPRCPPSSV